MKLRQKLAMVLASAMIVTAVPVTTMAASTNSFNKTLSIVADTAITTGQGLELIVDYTDAVKTGDVFYLTAKDFEFEKLAYRHKLDDGTYKAGSVATPGLQVTWNSKTELEVVVLPTATGAPGVEKVYVPVAGTPKKGTPAVTIDARGSFATGGTVALGGELTSDKALVATAGDAKNITIEGYGKLADITIEEQVAGTLSGKDITIKLPNSSDLEFSTEDVKVEGKRGLSAASDDAVEVEYVDVDNKKEVKITMPTAADTTRPGSFVIKGLQVVPEDRKEDVDTGDVIVTVKADKMDDTKLTVGKVVEAAVTMEVAEVKDLTSGHGKEKVKVTIKETTEGSLSKSLYLSLDGGKIVSMVRDADNKTHAGFDTILDKDGNIKEIELKPNTGDATTEYVLFLEVSAKADNTGDVTLTAEGRDLEDDIELVVAEAEAPFTIETKAFNLETGVKGQKGGEIVITEAKAGKLDRRQEFVIKSEDSDLKIEDAKVKVTDGDIKVKKDVKDGQLIITVESSSDEASEITISEIEMTAKKYVAEGKYDFLVGGTAVADTNVKFADEDLDATPAKKVFADKVTLENFVVTGDAANAVQSVVTLVVGQSEYTVDGETKVAEVAPFIDPATDRTMAPVRAVAEAFGCELDFFFPAGSDQLVIVLTKGNNRVQFQNGSNVMVVNGGQFIMSATAQIKDGYTYVPVAFLAQALNIDYTWDGATQTIVFGNN